MADEVFRAINLPKIPDDISDGMRDYLIELEKVITDLLIGDRYVAGNLHVGGDIVDE